jgi:hypothetical protein
VDLWGLAPRNLTQEEREKYMDEISRYNDYDNKENKMDIPDEYNCADVVTYLYDQAMTAAGYPDAMKGLQHEGKNISSAPEMQSWDYFFDQTNNITFYADKSFNSKDVEVGTIAVWMNNTGTGTWIGHVATVIEVKHDEKGNVTSIITIEGHMTKSTFIDKTNTSQAVWNTYAGYFVGFGEIGKKSLTQKNK